MGAGRAMGQTAPRCTCVGARTEAFCPGLYKDRDFSSEEQIKILTFRESRAEYKLCLAMLISKRQGSRPSVCF